MSQNNAKAAERFSLLLATCEMLAFQNKPIPVANCGICEGIVYRVVPGLIVCPDCGHVPSEYNSTVEVPKGVHWRMQCYESAKKIQEVLQ